ncbi:MAG: T9SS type A sorting domain-containing protein [Ignavibacteria bacterium]|nr:T9SS type A sorting domain-containing protein [Ignavibacteria bacterium]
MKKFVTASGLIFLIFLLSHLNVFSQVRLEWAVPYNGTANMEDEARGIAINNSGFVYVTGQSVNTHSTGNSRDVATVQYSPSGVYQQVRTYNGIYPNSWDAGNAVAVDRSGNVFVAGFTQKSSVDFDLLTIKYSSEDTNSIWGNTYDGYQRYDEAIDNITDDSGNVYVLGNSHDVSIDINVYMIILKYNSQGVLKWVNKYKGQYQAFAKAIALDRSGYVYATGITKDSDVSDFNYVTLKYNVSSGDSAWVQIYNPHPQSPGNDIASDIVADNSGNVYVTGASDSLSSSDFATVKYNSAGIQEWVRKYNGTANDNDVATCMVINSEGNICVSGYSKNIGTADDFATVCYDPSGTELWVSIYDGGSSPNNRAYVALLDSSGGIYVSGVTEQGRVTVSYTTIKLSSSGNLLWETSYNLTGTFIKIPSATIDRMTNIYVAGSSNNDYITIKYSQTPNAPSNLTLTPLGNGKIRLNWTDNSPNETGFSIQSKNDIDTNWIIKGSVAANITQWQDSGLISGTAYYYRVFAKNAAGNSPPSDTVNTIITNIISSSNIPEYFKLYQNYPNPFNPVTKISFDIPFSNNPVETKLIIHDISGRMIATLVNQEMSSGSYETEWDAVNYASGIYYYTIEAGNYKETKKMLLLK